MQAELFHIKKIGFISWADQIWGNPPKPLRRILSLMRMHKAECIVMESIQWVSSQDCQGHCWSTYPESCESCCEYIENLQHYKCQLLNKECFRLSFFKYDFQELSGLSSVQDTDYLGYCILHRDKILAKNVERDISYITESIIVPPFRQGRFSINGAENSSQLILGKIFSATGNYFSQQNGITNCCANASIKMALRENYPNLTAEKINNLRGVDHKIKKGNTGMRAREICEAIKGTTGMNSFLLTSTDLNTSDLLKLIYHAIESRLPIILLIAMSESNPFFNTNGIQGHAVAIKGHSFNEHNWWPYGLGAYFQGKANLSYLPSSLWCDNFIIQDDNMGPYYLLPVQFLFGKFFNSDKANWKDKVIDCVSRLIGGHTDNTWLTNPFEVIVPYKKEVAFFKKQVLQVEPWAIFVLNEIISVLSQESDFLAEKTVVSYFTEYYNKKSLILRTYVIDRERYIEHLKSETIVTEHVEINVFENILPEYFWITEISIPELFWINKKKVGELILDPRIFNGDDKHGVVHVRILNNVLFFENDSFQLYKLSSGGGIDWLFKLASARL